MSIPIKLLVIDLDGTSLGGNYKPYARFPDHFAAFLDRLSQKGWHWATNTTWGGQEQLELIRGSRLSIPPRYLMGDVGMRIWKIQNDQLVPIEPYNTRMAERMQENNKLNLHGIIQKFLNEFEPARINFCGHWFYFQCLDKDKERFQRFSSLMEFEKYGLYKFSCSASGIAIIHDFMGKDKSLAEVLKLEGLAPDDVIVAGDEFADISMMAPEISSNLICPANATEEVKTHVKRMNGIIAGKTFCDGIIEGVEKLLNKQEVGK